ncbi:MAG: hypothetical protein M1821_007614 [Bathelium mastoideum]|nr:MAG: hypothetical protein M1821_007614 [Bathelium mastoideum]
MSSLATQLTDDANCGVDFKAQNPNVLQAYDGFVSYGVLYHAGCQTDSNGNYCFANAATNTSAVTDSYPYYLPLGVALPGGAQPTCNTCLQNTMAIFSSAATNATQPVSANYKNAAEQINMVCGPGFVNQNVMVTSGGIRHTAGAGPLSLLLVLVVMVWSWL